VTVRQQQPRLSPQCSRTVKFSRPSAIQPSDYERESWVAGGGGGAGNPGPRGARGAGGGWLRDGQPERHKEAVVVRSVPV